MQEDVKKEEVEKMLGGVITDSQFAEALENARKKQEYIFQQEKRPVILQHWYLVKLVEEYVISLGFSKFTMDLCRTLSNMEKEHSTKSQSAHTDIHIVTGTAL